MQARRLYNAWKIPETVWIQSCFITRESGGRRLRYVVGCLAPQESVLEGAWLSAPRGS